MRCSYFLIFLAAILGVSAAARDIDVENYVRKYWTFYRDRVVGNGDKRWPLTPELKAERFRHFKGIMLRFAPHIVEELWETLGFAAMEGKMCCQTAWPVYDAAKTVASTVDMAVQVNGKLKGAISMPADSEEAAVVEAALAVDKVAKSVEGMKIVKTILVKNRLVNLIVKPQ